MAKANQLFIVYAKAFVAELPSAHDESIKEEINSLRQAFSDRELSRNLRTVSLTAEKRRQLLVSVFKDRLDPLVFNLLMVVADHGRLGYVDQILAAVISEIQKRQKIKRGRVYSPAQLDSSNLAELENTVGRKLGCRVQLEYVYQPELIAGFRIEVAGQLFDNTVKTQMEKIANQLLS